MSVDPSTATARRAGIFRTPLGTRGTLVACLFIAIVTVLSWLPRTSGPIDLRWDGGAYFIIGTSLAEGKGYRLQSEPGNFPSSVHAPFVPALVAAHEAVLGSSDPVVVGSALRVTTIAYSVAYAIAVFLLLRAYLPWPLALVAPLLAVFQPQYAYFSDELYAENFFGLFTVVFFILQRNRASLASFLWAGVFAALAYGARSVGIALLVAWVAETVLRRDFRRLPLVLVLVTVPVLAWMTWIKTAESSPEYQHPAYAYQTAPYVYFNVSYAKNILTLNDPFNPQLGTLTREGLVKRVATNLRELPIRVGQSLSSWVAPVGFSVFLGVLSMAGLVALLIRGQSIIVGYVVLSLAATVLTPFRAQFVRYLLPLYPFFALGLFLLVTLVARTVRDRYPAVPARVGHAAIGAVVVAIAVAEWQDGGVARLARTVRTPRQGLCADQRTGQRPSLLLCTLGHRLRRGAGLAEKPGPKFGRGRRDRSAARLSADRHESRAAALRTGRSEGATVDRHRAGSLPDHRSGADAARAGCLPSVHLGAGAGKPDLLGDGLDEPERRCRGL